jgi:hypothetical protein
VGRVLLTAFETAFAGAIVVAENFFDRLVILAKRTANAIITGTPILNWFIGEDDAKFEKDMQAIKGRLGKDFQAAIKNAWDAGMALMPRFQWLNLREGERAGPMREIREAETVRFLGDNLKKAGQAAWDFAQGLLKRREVEAKEAARAAGGQPEKLGPPAPTKEEWEEMERVKKKREREEEQLVDDVLRLMGKGPGGASPFRSEILSPDEMWRRIQTADPNARVLSVQEAIKKAIEDRAKGDEERKNLLEQIRDYQREAGWIAVKKG